MNEALRLLITDLRDACQAAYDVLSQDEDYNPLVGQLAGVVERASLALAAPQAGEVLTEAEQFERYGRLID